MRNTTRVAALAVGMALAFGQAPFVDAQPFDHLKCHKVKDPHKMKGTFDPAPALQPAFADQGCKIVRAKFFCAPVEKNNVQVNPPPAFPALGGQDLTNDFTCYKIKCPTQPPDTVVTDQFASRTLTKMKAQLLCVPTYKGVLTTTTSTTTTTTPTPCLNQTAPMCNGPCPDPLDTCVSVAGTTTCECTRPCGVDATGQCSGDCPIPTDVCTQLADGTCDCGPPKCEDFVSGPGQCGGPCPPNFICDNDLVGLPCKCFPNFPCGDPVDLMCGGFCQVSQTCISDPVAGCICQ